MQTIIEILLASFIILLSIFFGIILERSRIIQRMLFFLKQKFLKVKSENRLHNEKVTSKRQNNLNEHRNSQTQLNSLSIGITTFPARYESLFNQISQIRQIDDNIDILLTVNSFFEQVFDQKYTDKILDLCKQFNVFPVFFPQFSGLAKMWNTLIRHSPTTHILILNDDIEISNNDFINEISRIIETKEMFTINNSFAHFVISKREAIKMNFFSEIFLAFGEEDGDFYWRYVKKYNNNPESVSIDGVINKTLNSDDCDNTIDTYKDPYGGNKPKISQEITSRLYVADKQGIKGMYDQPYLRKFDDPIQYPYDQFVLNNWENIGKYRDIIW